MRRLKADLHTHSGDDPRDRIGYSSEQLIDRVAERGVDVLAITCHEANVYTESLAEYAQRFQMRFSNLSLHRNVPTFRHG